MLYYIAHNLKCNLQIFNVIHYVSVRSIASLLTALILSLIMGGWFIEKSKSLFRSKVRPLTPEHHKVKNDTPTMGGLLILLVVCMSIFLWNNLADIRVWVFLMTLLGSGAIGFWDDWSKIKHRKGISAATKFTLQLFIAFLVVGSLVYFNCLDTTISFPFFKWFNPDLGILFILWGMLVLVGCSNAVNLTDGLDGLAIGSLIPNFATFSIICYLAGHCAFASYLNIPFVASAEIAVIGAALIGASLGFLWYNTYPAHIFMGDVGSLALGSALGFMALIAKQELLLLLAGGLFVVEALSVIIQVMSFKLRGKRVFKMAPLHHHFELLGWRESTITARFGIISLILCLLALVTLKLR